MLIYIDGFDSYTTTDLPKRWSDNTGAGGWAIGSSAGRNGTGCLQVTTTNARQQARTFLGNKASVVVGFAFKCTGLGAAAGSPICTLYDVANPHIVLKVDSVGNLLLFSGTTQIASYGAGIIANAWYYIEIKVTISNSISANTCVIRVNGVAVITPAATTNLRQGGGSNNSVDRFVLGVDGTWTSSLTISYDDLYMFDSSGSTNNGLIGDIRVETIMPTGAGTTTQWTANTGSNYAAVNESTQNGDTTYVATTTVTNADTYAMGDLSSTPATVYGVQLAITARKDDAGTRTVAGSIKSGSTTYDHASTNALGLGDSYTTLIDLWETDPNGSIAWTGTSINALEAGIKLAG